MDNDEASGWDAIDAALAGIYGDAAPRHVGYYPPRGLNGGVLQGCSAYDAGAHWHYITYGLSELYIPEPDADPRVSGWGFELTMRVAREIGPAAPAWPFTMLNQIARHISRTSSPLQPGHRIDLRAPVTGYPHVDGAPDTRLTVLATLMDPELGEITSPNGTVRFLQLVGVTAREKESMLASSTVTVLDELARDNPLLITDPSRA